MLEVPGTLPPDARSFFHDESDDDRGILFECVNVSNFLVCLGACSVLLFENEVANLEEKERLCNQ